MKWSQDSHYRLPTAYPSSPLPCLGLISPTNPATFALSPIAIIDHATMFTGLVETLGSKLASCVTLHG